jgi:hypothetical protein
MKTKENKELSSELAISEAKGVLIGALGVALSLKIYLNTTNDKGSLLKIKKLINKRLREIKKNDY